MERGLLLAATVEGMKWAWSPVGEDKMWRGNGSDRQEGWALHPSADALSTPRLPQLKAACCGVLLGAPGVRTFSIGSELGRQALSAAHQPGSWLCEVICHPRAVGFLLYTMGQSYLKPSERDTSGDFVPNEISVYLRSVRQGSFTQNNCLL